MGVVLKSLSTVSKPKICPRRLDSLRATCNPLSATLFLWHVNDMLEDSNILCCGDDSKVNAVYPSYAGLSWENVSQHHLRTTDNLLKSSTFTLMSLFVCFFHCFIHLFKICV